VVALPFARLVFTAGVVTAGFSAAGAPFDSIAFVEVMLFAPAQPVRWIDRTVKGKKP